MVPEEGTIDWVFEAARWWLSNFGGFAEFATTPIVLPTKEDFPVDTSLCGHALTEDYFGYAKEHARLGDWPLVMVSEAVPNVAEILHGMPHGMTAPVSGSTAGPMQDGDPLAIPYDPSLLDDPVALVATMARGMSHYHLYGATTEFPGEAEDREYFVDLGAVFLGFGVFLANSAFRFQQTESGMMVGWGCTRRGALSELDVSYVLALACALTGAPDKPILRSLSANPKSFFKAARKHLRKKRRDDVERLRSVEAPNDGPYR
ncbi:MAG: hypothetical protein AAGE52_08920 [Myxococcota bacterium]